MIAAIEKFPEKWEACVSQFPEELKPVVAGYVIEQSYYEEPEYVRFPTPEEFDSLYCGEWDNFLEFCKVEMTNYGIDIDSWDMAAPYLRIDRIDEDLGQEYYTFVNPNGKLWVYAVEW